MTGIPGWFGLAIAIIYRRSVSGWQRIMILFAGGNTNLYGYVENDPVNRVDPEGLDSAIVYLGGSIHLGGCVSYMSGIATDTNGRICFVSNICGTVGPGIYGDLGFEIEGDSADLCESVSESDGAFAKGCDGIVSGGSITGNNSGHSASAGFGGIGGGAATGYIHCKKTTICIN